MHYSLVWREKCEMCGTYTLFCIHSIHIYVYTYRHTQNRCVYFYTLALNVNMQREKLRVARTYVDIYKGILFVTSQIYVLRYLNIRRCITTGEAAAFCSQPSLPYARTHSAECRLRHS